MVPQPRSPPRRLSHRQEQNSRKWISKSEGKSTWLLGLWRRCGMHLCVSAEAVQIPFDCLQGVVAALLPRLRTSPAGFGESSLHGWVGCKTMWRRTHLGFDTAEQPQLLLLLLKLSSFPVLLQHLLLMLQAFSKKAQTRAERECHILQEPEERHETKGVFSVKAGKWSPVVTLSKGQKWVFKRFSLQTQKKKKKTFSEDCEESVLELKQ